MIYPPNPVPAFKLEGKLEGKACAGSRSLKELLMRSRSVGFPKAVFNKLAKFMPDQTEKLTKDWGNETLGKGMLLL